MDFRFFRPHHIIVDLTTIELVKFRPHTHAHSGRFLLAQKIGLIQME